MDTLIRATVAYWVLLATLRLLGRRTSSQQSPFELLVLFFLGGISIQAVVGDDRSLINAVLAIFTIALNHRLASQLRQRSERFRKLMDGTPVVIVEDGNIRHDRVHNLRMTEEDVLAATRDKGIRDLREVELAVAERDGGISVLRR